MFVPRPVDNRVVCSCARRRRFELRCRSVSVRNQVFQLWNTLFQINVSGLVAYTDSVDNKIMSESMVVRLKQELERRVAQNPAYSLRAFAKQLKMSPGALSEVLKGQRAISLRAFDRMT